ncbi:scarecrow protein [Salix suchowensis]|nr:scarecrow protein [Salix suchowensis]
MRRKSKRSREDHVFNPLMNSYEGCSEGKIYRLLQMREQMIKLDDKKKAVQRVSLIGDSVQRVVAYFADGLVARLLTKKSPPYNMIMKEPTSEQEFLAFIEMYSAILEAYEKEEENNKSALHVIDLDVSSFFQWPSLIQSLSEKTAFQGLLRGSKLTNLRVKKNETVAVNSIFHLNTLKDSLKISDTLKLIHSLNPSIVVLVEQEGSRSSRSFLSRFLECLHYFAAILERFSVKKNHLRKEIKSILNYYKNDTNCPRYDKMETWKGRIEGHGFGGMRLSSKTHYCPLQFDGENDGKTISLGWQDRCLITISTW